jgi:hypothetical protein
MRSGFKGSRVHEFKVQGSRFRVQGFKGSRVRGSEFKGSGFKGSGFKCSRCRVQRFKGFRVHEFRVPFFALRATQGRQG